MQSLRLFCVLLYRLGKIRLSLRFYAANFFPKYLTEGDVDEYLKDYGIVHGLNDLDFGDSSLLDDGRSIKIAVVYKVNTKRLTFGLVDTDIMLRQVAITAAWVTPNNASDEGSKLKSIVDAVIQSTKETADDPNKGKTSN